MLARVKLLHTPKSYLYYILIVATISGFSLLFTYHDYTNLKQFDSYKAKALLLFTRYNETKHRYLIGFRYNNTLKGYIYSKKDYSASVGHYVDVVTYTTKLTFIEYLKKRRYFHGYIAKVYPDKPLQYRLADLIVSAHYNKEIGALYATLFCATPLPKAMYEQITLLGIPHLVAISGYHLSLLFMLLYAVFNIFYKPIHRRYFPFRHRKRDVTVVVMALLYGYGTFLAFPPSVMRALAMLFIGYILYDRGIEIVSFETLFITVTLLVAFDISLLFSTGFWLSVAGVFYIFLFLQYAKNLHVALQFIAIHIWMYLAMLPLSLYLFGSYSNYHFLSIILTMLFNLFYPLSMFAHLLGYGELFDPLLERLLHIDMRPIEVVFPLWALMLHVALSLIVLFFGLSNSRVSNHTKK